MWVVCKDCYKKFHMKDAYHLADGQFLCPPCFQRDEHLRKQFNLEPNKLMINPDAKQGGVAKLADATKAERTERSALKR